MDQGLLVKKQQKAMITAPPFAVQMKFYCSEESKNTSLFCNHFHCDFSISTHCFLQIASS